MADALSMRLARLRRTLGSQDGFSLIELMTVVLILAILIAIAVPTFLSLRRKADDASAKSSAVNAMKSAKSLVERDETYAPVTVASLSASEPSLTFLPGNANSTGPKEISQESPDPAMLTYVVAVYSHSGTCFFMRDDLTAGSVYGRLDGQPVADCRADNQAAVVFGDSW
jgi:type IV pilus assembly protein PilA